MSVIPLTLTISLCLVFTFVIFFIRESSRRRYSSAERNALLPLADETPRLEQIATPVPVSPTGEQNRVTSQPRADILDNRHRA